MWVIWYIFVVYNPSVLVANEVRKRMDQKTNQKVVEPGAKNMKPEKETRKKRGEDEKYFSLWSERRKFFSTSEENEWREKKKERSRREREKRR